MNYFEIQRGATSQVVEFDVFDSSSSVGARLAGLAYNTSGLTAYYNRQNASGAATAISLVTMTKGTWTSGGFVAVDATNMPGVYQLCLPDAAIAAAAGVNFVTVTIRGAANMVPVVICVRLTDWVRSTTPANTLDVSATGEAGLDFANVKQATGSTTLTNIIVPNVTTVDSVTGGATAANQSTIMGYLDTEIAAILAAVDTEIAAVVEAVITNAAGADVAADIIAAKADLVEILTRVPDATAGDAGGLAIVGSEMDLIDAPNATALAAVAIAFLDTLLSAGDSDALNARTVRSCFRVLRNMVDLDTDPGTMHVKKENDSDDAWTAPVTTDASAEPITKIDPA